MNRRGTRSSISSDQAPPAPPSPPQPPPPSPPLTPPPSATSMRASLSLPTHMPSGTIRSLRSADQERRVSATAAAAVIAAEAARRLASEHMAPRNTRTSLSLRHGSDIVRRASASRVQRDSLLSQHSIQSGLQPSFQYLMSPQDAPATPPDTSGIPRTAAAAHSATLRAFASRSANPRFPSGSLGSSSTGLIAAASAKAVSAVSAASAAADPASQVTILKPTVPPEPSSTFYPHRRESDASNSSRDTSPSSSLLEVVRQIRLNRRISDSVNSQNFSTLSRPSSVPHTRTSAFILPPLPEELDITRRYSSLSSSLDHDSSESLPLKSALRTKEKSADKRGIRFNESADIEQPPPDIELVKVKPAIIWIVGPPAVGKNTLSKYILSEIIKRQATCSILNWPIILARHHRQRPNPADTSDQAITTTVTTVLNSRKSNPNDVVLINNFPLNIHQADLFELQVRTPDAILSLTAAEKTLESRWTELHRKPLTHTMFLARTEKYYRDIDPILARYKQRVLTLDADQPINLMWERVQEVLTSMQVISGISWFSKT